MRAAGRRHPPAGAASRPPAARGERTPASPFAASGVSRPATAHGILQLQQSAGNQATLRYLRERRSQPARLGVGRVLDVQRVNWSTASEDTKAKAYAAACAKNDQERERLKGYIQEGLRQNADVRLRNSCEWIFDGLAMVYALTGTHDAKEEAEASHRVRYFPYNTFGMTAASIYVENPYYVDPTSPHINLETTVVRRGKADMGFRQGTDIAIVMENPVSGEQNNRDQIFITLKHEVQHMADRHPEGNDELGAAIETYRTEYRAYFLMGDPKYDQWPTDEGDLEGGPDALHTLDYRWPNARQYVILGQIYSEYPEVKKAWDRENDPSLTSSHRPFHQAVREFTRPVSLNPDNSMRVERFYRALEGVDPTSSPSDASVTHFLDRFMGKTRDARGEKLTPGDADAILDGPFEREYKAKLDAALWKLLFQRLNGVASISVKTLWNRRWV